MWTDALIDEITVEDKERGENTEPQVHFPFLDWAAFIPGGGGGPGEEGEDAEFYIGLRRQEGPGSNPNPPI